MSHLENTFMHCVDPTIFLTKMLVRWSLSLIKKFLKFVESKFSISYYMKFLVNKFTISLYVVELLPIVDFLLF